MEFRACADFCQIQEEQLQPPAKLWYHGTIINQRYDTELFYSLAEHSGFMNHTSNKLISTILIHDISVQDHVEGKKMESLLRKSSQFSTFSGFYDAPKGLRHGAH